MSDMRLFGLAGDTTFTPRLSLTEDQSENLRREFVERVGCDAAENGAILLDWTVNNADGPPYTAREVISMYRDGADDEDPWVIFWRTGHAGQPAALHVPPQHIATHLAFEAAWMHVAVEKFAATFAETTAYLDTVVNDPAAWDPFDINRDPWAVEDEGS